MTFPASESEFPDGVHVILVTGKDLPIPVSHGCFKIFKAFFSLLFRHPLSTAFRAPVAGLNVQGQGFPYMPLAALPCETFSVALELGREACAIMFRGEFMHSFNRVLHVLFSIHLCPLLFKIMVWFGIFRMDSF